MNTARRYILSFGAFLLAACAPVETPAETPPVLPPVNSNVEIRLDRGVCFGFCPAYTVTINGEGQVRYEGRSFVNAVGERTATIPRGDVAGLVARFDEIGFERLNDAYRANVTDLPTYRVSITRNGRTKTVVDYGGPNVGMPRAVRDLQAEIDRVAGTAQWVLRDGQPVRDRPEH
ncbi:MAG: hypothetical protein JNL81_09975 [Hyphomonadaceae bacterium]|nr:hypothetical protein [Hyphomonadaceae bacterium]